VSLFFTATGSDVGKTIACALVAHRYATALTGQHVAYWKPIATGVPEATGGRRLSTSLAPGDDDNAPHTDAAVMARLGPPNLAVLPAVYSYKAAVAPHWAARQARRPIDREAMTAAFRGHQARHSALLVEGVGGLMVPLDDRGTLLVDWVQQLHVACVVVAHTGLGTLNHTLLTLEALAHRHVQVAGIILNGPPHQDNQRTLTALCDAPILGTLPWLTPLNAAAIARAAVSFDPDGHLAAHLAPAG
jgi:dethiobiotin synthetase